MKGKILVIIITITTLVLGGCCAPKEEVVIAPPPEPMQPPEMVPCAAPRMVQTISPHPTEAAANGQVSLAKLMPKEIPVNEPFDYRMKVTNLTGQKLLNVVVTDLEPPHMKLLSSEPKMEQGQGQVQWRLGAIAPHASKTIAVSAKALKKQTITTCAKVTYDTATCATIEIVDPRLKLEKHAPKVSLRCDRIPVTYKITNTGSGHACDVVIKDNFSEGMVTSAGKGEVSFSIDTLGAGQSKEFNVMVDATKPGRYASRAIATSRVGGQAQSDIADTLATEPVLMVEHSGPRMQYVGHSATYNVKIANNGDAVAKDTILEVMIPEEVVFDGATEGGVFTRSSPGKVTWNLGMLEPGQSRNHSLTVTSQNPGSLTTRATAKAYCAKTVAQSARTTYSGIPAILLEVVDLSDPVELGEMTTYVITVTNQGSATSTNIMIKCMLEEGMEYVSSSGPSIGAVDGNQIMFAPLARLAPKARAKWLINVKATGDGDKRFKATLTTRQLERTVEETEATKFYGQESL
ncbi:MAG: CARDB domain-containing protein [Planctomycetota bacterium]|jgi:uncharacterized repeat protein (TIGR01451 family)